MNGESWIDIFLFLLFIGMNRSDIILLLVNSTLNPKNITFIWFEWVKSSSRSFCGCEDASQTLSAWRRTLSAYSIHLLRTLSSEMKPIDKRLSSSLIVKDRQKYLSITRLQILAPRMTTMSSTLSCSLPMEILNVSKTKQSGSFEISHKTRKRYFSFHSD